MSNAHRRLRTILGHESYGPKLARLRGRPEREVLQRIEENRGREARELILHLDEQRRAAAREAAARRRAAKTQTAPGLTSGTGRAEAARAVMSQVDHEDGLGNGFTSLSAVKRWDDLVGGIVAGKDPDWGIGVLDEIARATSAEICAQARYYTQFAYKRCPWWYH